MARSAARGGLNAPVWNRSPVSTSDSALGDVRMAESPAGAVQGADVVVTMVPTAEAVFSIMKERQALAAMKPGAVWIQMSTIGVEGTERAWRLARTRPEIVFVDAPVSGSKTAAEEAKLVILASGDQARAGAPVQQFFDAVGTKTHWLGSVGQGSRMKLMFNAWMGILNEGIAEVSILGDELGIDQGQFASLVTGGPLVPLWAVTKLHTIKEGRAASRSSPALGTQRR